MFSPELFERLSKSKFRSQFRLNTKDAGYLSSKGLPLVLTHAREFLTERLAPAQPLNDGAQTPMRGHPVFVAQHATGTCCRDCLAKWHNMEKDRTLTTDEVGVLVEVIGEWLSRQDVAPAPRKEAAQLSFF